MRVTFFSNAYGTANGFNCIYIVRKAFEEAVPKTGKIGAKLLDLSLFLEGSDAHHCGHVIQSGSELTSGWLSSPGFPIKYSQNQLCDWQIIARPQHQVIHDSIN
jgi:hypothetical protein